MYVSIVFLPLFGALTAGWLSLGSRDRAAELVTVSFLLLSLLFSIVAFAQVGIGGQARLHEFIQLRIIEQVPPLVGHRRD